MPLPSQLNSGNRSTSNIRHLPDGAVVAAAPSGDGLLNSRLTAEGANASSELQFVRLLLSP